MQLRIIKGFGIGIGSGFCVGVIMVLLGMDWKDAAFATKTAGAWKLLNQAALWAADWWARAGLPPTNESAWVVTPAVMVLAQWSIVGFLAALWWARRLDGKVDKERSPQKQR